MLLAVARKLNFENFRDIQLFPLAALRGIARKLSRLLSFVCKKGALY